MNEIEALLAAGTRLEGANEERANAMEQVVEAVVAAKKAGCTVVSISKLVGVTRQTVYTILEENKCK